MRCNCHSIIQYVFSKNAERRDLTESQRGIITVKFTPLLEKEAEEARKRQVTHLKRGAKSPVETMLSQREGRARDIAAKTMKIGSGTLQDASRSVKRGIPEIADKILAGEISVATGRELTYLPKDEQKSTIVLEFDELFIQLEKEGRKRKIRKSANSVNPNLDLQKGNTLSKLAEMAGIGHGSMGDAVRVKKWGRQHIMRGHPADMLLWISCMLPKPLQ